ncbi:hypothetical protein R5R35_006665 [Gryllus longicercus]|uniref:Cytochrome P450 n=1 Tax=Gryllus longicercus TaxID=2509291 RepID=A0AAN9VR50_9ORTH
MLNIQYVIGSPCTTALTILAIVTGVLYWYCTNTFDYWKKKGVPYVPPTPFFGNIAESLLGTKNFNFVHQELYNRFKGHRFVGIYHAKKPVLLLRDPELIKLCLVKDFQNFHDRDSVIINPEKNILQQNLVNLAGQKWRVLRNKLSPTFTSGKIKNMFPLMIECCANVVSYLQESANRQEIVEMKEVLAKLSTDVIGSCAFGLQMNALDDPNSEFRRMGRLIFEPSLKARFGRFLLLMVPDLGNWINLDFMSSEMNEFFFRIVKETADYRIKNNIIRNDFFQLLLNLKQTGSVDDEDKQGQINGVGDKTQDLDFEMNDAVMAAQAFVFFAAGFETSSTTMSFALHELAVNTDIQEKVRKEIDTSLEETGGEFTYESIMNLKYLDKVVSETLRMYSAVMFLRRGVTIPYTIPGTNVLLDKGSSVVIPVYALHHDPEYFPEPKRFDPERFSDEEKAKRPHYVYLPFGEGPRNCIGMRFGLLQTKLGLATLLSKYEFDVCERTEVPLRLSPNSFVLASTSGTVVRISNRRKLPY